MTDFHTTIHNVVVSHVPEVRGVGKLTKALVEAVSEVVAKDINIENARLRDALCHASDQLIRVYDDAFKQTGGYGLVTTDGRDFSCLQLNMCEAKGRVAKLILEEIGHVRVED